MRAQLAAVGMARVVGQAPGRRQGGAAMHVMTELEDDGRTSVGTPMLVPRGGVAHTLSPGRASIAKWGRDISPFSRLIVTAQWRQLPPVYALTSWQSRPRYRRRWTRSCRAGQISGVGPNIAL